MPPPDVLVLRHHGPQQVPVLAVGRPVAERREQRRAGPPAVPIIDGDRSVRDGPRIGRRQLVGVLVVN